MFKDFSFPRHTPWLQRVWQDLQPTPGRLNRSLRMTLASILVLVLMLVLKMPSIDLWFVLHFSHRTRESFGIPANGLCSCCDDHARDRRRDGGWHFQRPRSVGARPQ